MAYSASNPPALIAQKIGGGGRVYLWETAEAAGTVDANDYIENGYALGMRASDTVLVVDTNTPLTTMHRVESATAGGAADLAVGTTVGSATTGD